MKQTFTERLHIVEGADWKDAVISLLDSRSPYRPWRYGFGEAHDGDPVAVVLNTDPPSVLTSLGRIGIDGRLDRALITWPFHGPGLVDLTTLTMIVGLTEDPRNSWRLHGDAAHAMELALSESEYRVDPAMRFGHSPVVAARVLLHSEGRCTGCGDNLDLSGEDARETVHIHTIDAPPREDPQVLVKTERVASYANAPIPDSYWRPDLPADWPGVLCQRCRIRMRDDGYRRLLDFRFSQHPKCHRCGAARTQRATFGELPSSAFVNLPPWKEPRGCCVTEDIWTCSLCLHRW